MMFSVSDILGVNPLLRQVLANAAAAAVGMGAVPRAGLTERTRPVVAITNLGVLTAGTMRAMERLDAAGYDPVIVETVGIGQSEVSVAGMVDFFLVLLLAGDDFEIALRVDLQVAYGTYFDGTRTRVDLDLENVTGPRQQVFRERAETLEQSTAIRRRPAPEPERWIKVRRPDRCLQCQRPRRAWVARHGRP